MDGIGGLGRNQHRTAHRLQERRVGFDGVKFRIDIAREELGRVPAADEAVAIGLEDRAQPVGGARKLVAKLHAGKTGGLCLFEAGFQRNIAADLQHVVIRPADWVRPDTDHSLVPSVLRVKESPDAKALCVVRQAHHEGGG